MFTALGVILFYPACCGLNCSKGTPIASQILMYSFTSIFLLSFIIMLKMGSGYSCFLSNIRLFKSICNQICFDISSFQILTPFYFLNFYFDFSQYIDTFTHFSLYVVFFILTYEHLFYTIK